MPWLARPIRTTRLVLRAPEDADLEDFVRLMTDPDVRGYLGGPVPVERARAALAGPLGERWGSFVIEAGGEVVGSCLLDRERGELEISYQLLPEFWGHGYAREAVSAVLEWAWATTEARMVIAVTRRDNLSSVRLLDAVGMEQLSTLEENGAPQILYRMMRPALVTQTTE
jgi:RimJ/RimL family protein N-acetyltransferase